MPSKGCQGRVARHGRGPGSRSVAPHQAPPHRRGLRGDLWSPRRGDCRGGVAVSLPHRAQDPGPQLLLRDEARRRRSRAPSRAGMGSSSAEISSTPAPGSEAVRRWQVSSPSMPGRLTSSSTKSGCRRSRRASASSPVVTSASDSKPGVALMTARAASRKSGWSSTVRTRTGMASGHAASAAGAGNGADRRAARRAHPSSGVPRAPPRRLDRQVEQDGGDAAADHVLARQAELEEDRADVLLDRALGEHEILGDRGVALAGRHGGEHLALARRQSRPAASRAGAPRSRAACAPSRDRSSSRRARRPRSPPAAGGRR